MVTIIRGEFLRVSIGVRVRVRVRVRVVWIEGRYYFF